MVEALLSVPPNAITLSHGDEVPRLLTRSRALRIRFAFCSSAELHDRMPAILSADDSQAWLDRNTPRADLVRMLVPSRNSKTKKYPVTSRVNSADFDASELLNPVDVEVGQTPSKSNRFEEVANVADAPSVVE